PAAWVPSWPPTPPPEPRRARRRFLLPRFLLPRFLLPRFLLPRFLLPRFLLPMEAAMAPEAARKPGIGYSLPRREDDRFIRGQGTFFADPTAPRMAHMAVRRSPLARARIRSINAARAFTLPGVLVVITGELLARRNLAWMPTLSGDVQAILAVDEVRFQGQEVACVVAEDPYTAHDALQLIEVDYEPLTALADPTEALSPDAPLVRADKADTRCYEWEAGEPDATDRAFAAAAHVTT